MDYSSDTHAQVDAPPAKRQRRDNRVIPEDEVVVLKEKIVIPIEKYPGHNFVGSLLGPQGSIMKELQKVTRAKISILGKGSMKDKKKEAELMTSDEEEHAHLKEPLHVVIDIKSPRAEAHRRMAAALMEIYKFMVPAESQQQQQQQGPYDAYGGGGYGAGGYGGGGYGGGGYGGPPQGRGGPPQGRGGPPRGASRGRGGRGAPRGGYGAY